MSIILVTSSAELHHKFSIVVGDSLLAVTAQPVPADPAVVLEQLPEDTVLEVFIVDCTEPDSAGVQLARGLHQHCPTLSVVLVSSQGSDLALAALRAGAHDIVDPQEDPSELGRVLDEAVEAARSRRAAAAPANAAAIEEAAPSAASSGRVITVVSPKGGVGKTTVATNLAVGLARVAPRATVLVDLDIQFGDVASGLNLDPEYHLPSVVHGPASRDSMVLKTFLTLHETGLYVVCAPESPAAADTVTAADVSRLLRTLAAEFSYVVVDTAPGLSEHTLAAMDESSDLVLLTSMDVPGLRGLRRELDTLSDLGMHSNRVIVLNFCGARVGLSRNDVEATIGTTVDVMLPRSKAAPASVNLGVPLLQSGNRDAMAKRLRKLVDRFVTTAPEAAPASPPTLDRGKKSRPLPRRAASGWFRRPKVVSS
jgi:pilus assembly protein CpaE